MNKHYDGDNPEVAREAIADASVDLICVDPALDSNAGNNVLWRDRSRGGADAKMEAFGDSWTSGKAGTAALVSPVKKAAPVETRASHQKDTQGTLL